MRHTAHVDSPASMRVRNKDGSVTLTPLRIVRRSISHISDDERRVIHERRYGWEKASIRDLARIFCTTTQAITQICREG